ncbi:DUF6286 domain-containing protein [Nocardia sp. NPDC050406]|uniref:DUF6286 domain-containing protein n=1 Tax=Nocardia sp. NPDC050406 TaxID=3364318 RepID=UPI003787A270
MIRRPRRVVTAALVAIALLALCVAVAVALIQRLAGAREFVSYDSVATRLHDTTWGDPLVLAVGIGVALLGAVLVASALVPGRATVIPLEPVDGSAAGIERRSLRTALRRSALGVGGIDSARVRLRGKTIRVSANSDRVDIHDLPETVRAAVADTLDRIGPRESRQVLHTKLRPAKTKGA